jgi:hypothetical protein
VPRTEGPGCKLNPPEGRRRRPPAGERHAPRIKTFWMPVDGGYGALGPGSPSTRARRKLITQSGRAVLAPAH